jgi:hypothetical protein
MYTKGKNGERVEVNLPVVNMRMPENSGSKQIKENYEKPEGSNKVILYIALVLGIAVVIGSAYMLYRDNKNKKPKMTEKFGYSLA